MKCCFRDKNGRQTGFKFLQFSVKEQKFSKWRPRCINPCTDKTELALTRTPFWDPSLSVLKIPPAPSCHRFGTRQANTSLSRSTGMTYEFKERKKRRALE